MKKSNEDFLREARKKNDKVDIIGPYIKQSEKILVQCKTCEKQYYALPGNILKGCDCYNHNIKLLRIPYWDYKNIEQILSQELTKNHS